MLRLLRTSLPVRLSLLLFAVTVAGALLGFAWEDAVYSHEPDSPLEKAEQRAAAMLPPPARSPERTREEQAILARSLAGFPPYPGVSSAPEVLAADYLGPDVPIAVSWFSTKDSPRQVLSHYRSLLMDAGLPPLSADLGTNGGYVGYWSPADDEVRLVSVLAQGGETLVFVSAGQMAKLAERGSKIPDWMPMPAAAVDPQLISLKMEGATNHVVTGKMAEDSLAESEADWRKALDGRGWHMGNTAESMGQTRAFEVSHDGTVGQMLLRQTGVGVEFNLSLMQRAQTSE
ncbi:hypothetical protein DRW03_29860 [Corallococcus sp. H22C18031201]|nr:hypothetical protein DRW03_29860 [Corallococcus sp. H22C18031201]